MLAIFAVNFYVCARIFKIPIFGGLYSIEGVHIALAKAIELGGSNFYGHWYAGIPFPNTYPPLMPRLVGTISRYWVHDTGLAYHIVCGIFYCLGPVALFLLLYELSKKLPVSLLAALAASAISPSIWFVPGIFDELHSNFGPRRLQVMIEWGEGPHIAAITLMLFAFRAVLVALRKRAAWSYGLASALSAGVLITNWIGATALGLGVVIYLASARAGIRQWGEAVAMGLGGYALAARWMPLSTMMVIRENSQLVPENYRMGQEHAIAGACILAACVGLNWVLEKYGATLAARVVTLLGLVFTLITMSREWFGFGILPQPRRYHIEMELFLIAAAIFLFSMVPMRWLKLVAAMALLAGGFFTVREARRYSRKFILPSAIERTTEYKIAMWLRANQPGGRVFAPGTFSQWLNTFNPEQDQLGGGFDQGVPNRLMLDLLFQLTSHKGTVGGKVSKVWLEAFGTGAVVVSNDKSEEFFKPFPDKKKFDGVLPVLYQTEGETIYGADPLRSALAVHVSKQAMERAVYIGSVRTDAIEAMLATIPTERPVEVERFWDGFRLRVNPMEGEVVSVRLNALAGWQASSGVLRKNGLGLITIEPPRTGPQVIELKYSKPLEYRILGWVTIFTALFFVGWIGFGLRRKLLGALPKNNG